MLREGTSPSWVVLDSDVMQPGLYEVEVLRHSVNSIKAVYINIQRAPVTKLWSQVPDNCIFKAKVWTSSYDEAVDSSMADSAPRSDGVVCHPGNDRTTCIKLQPDCTIEVYVTSSGDDGILMLDSQVVAPTSLQVMGGRYMPECGREVISRPASLPTDAPTEQTSTTPMTSPSAY